MFSPAWTLPWADPPAGQKLPPDAAGVAAAQAWCGGGWVMGRLAGPPEAPLVEEPPPPQGEGGSLEVWRQSKE